MDETTYKSFSMRLPSTSDSNHRKKLIRVATKVNEEEMIDKSLEKDFLLETGDATEFLKDKEPLWCLKRESVSRLSSVGSSRRLESKEKTEPMLNIKKEPRRRLTSRQTIVRLDAEILINAKIQDIQQRIKREQQLQQEKIKSLAYREKVSYLKQQKSLSMFQKTTQK